MTAVDDAGGYGYTSPFSRRYGSEEMRRVWSERHRRELWRTLWVALADAQRSAGITTAEQVDDLRRHVTDVDLGRAHAIETACRHELVAELRTFAAQCPTGGKVLHLGATTADIQDNADALRLREALDLVLARLTDVLAELAERIERFADLPSMGFTHLQPAEPTTVGYRLAQYGQDLLQDLDELRRVRAGIRGKGLKGAVGTSASFVELLRRRNSSEAAGDARELEERFMSAIGLGAYDVTTQTYPRKQDWFVATSLAGLAGSLSRFALDLRVLQSPGFAEWYEPSSDGHVSSSAMPSKRNPAEAEGMNSLARLVAALPRVLWDNAAHSILERTLDDSAASREALPTAFLAVDEILLRALRILRELEVDPGAVERNMTRYGAFAGLERVLLACCAGGADRQQLHDALSSHARAARAAPDADVALRQRLAADPVVAHCLSGAALDECLDVSSYTGDAAVRARRLAAAIRAESGR